MLNVTISVRHLICCSCLFLLLTCDKIITTSCSPVRLYSVRLSTHLLHVPRLLLCAGHVTLCLSPAPPDLIHCTNELNVSIPHLADTLLERSSSSSWIVVFKALIATHHLMMYGNEVSLGAPNHERGRGGGRGDSLESGVCESKLRPRAQDTHTNPLKG